MLVKSEDQDARVLSIAPVVEEKIVFRFTKPLSPMSRQAPGDIIIGSHIDDEVIGPVSVSGPRFPMPSIAGVPVREQESSVPRYPALLRPFQASSTVTVARKR